MADGIGLEAEVGQYLDLSVDELWRVLEESWSGASGASDQRGVVSFTRGVAIRLANGVAEQHATVSATVGVAVSEVLTWAQTQGVDLTTFRVPLAVASALVVKAVLNPGGRAETDHDDG